MEIINPNKKQILYVYLENLPSSTSLLSIYNDIIQFKNICRSPVVCVKNPYW